MFALLFFAATGAIVSVTLTYSYGFAIAFLSTVLTASVFTALGAILIVSGRSRNRPARFYPSVRISPLVEPRHSANRSINLNSSKDL